MRSFLRALTLNWQLKLLAFALAVLLWVINSAEQTTSDWIPVPLQIRETDPNFQLIEGAIPQEVQVRFTGTGRDLIDVAIRKPPLLLSISDVSDPQQVFNLEPGMVQVPNQLAVSPQDVRPRTLPLRFRQLARRSIPVRVSADRAMADGWALIDALQVRPERVEVRGPSERVSEVESIRTLPFTLPRSDTTFTRWVGLDTAQVQGLDLSVRRVQVSGRVERVVERTVAEVPVTVGPGIAVRPSSVDVRITGPRSMVEGLRASDLRVAVAVDSLPARIPPEGLSVPLRVERLPSGVQGSPAPPAVRLVPRRLPQDTVDVPRSPQSGDPDGDQRR